jgi:5-methylcytosine-specific restriction enzyme B
MIPDASREEIIKAMKQFDTELRNTDEWKGWERKKNHKYAIQFEEQLYPVKKIIAMAAGISRNEFSGGSESITYLQKREFAIQPLKRSYDMSLEEFVEAVDKEKYAESIQKGEEERQTLLQMFPKEHWPEMTLKEYALGQEGIPENYCYMMEFGTMHVAGMRGGSAAKLIIYCNKSTQEWMYDKQRWKSSDDAWGAIKNGYMELFQKAENGDWNTIDEIETLTTGQALRCKTCHIYFPDEILSVNSKESLLYFLTRFEYSESDLRAYGSVRLNRMLLEKLREIPALEDWSPLELGYVLYDWDNPQKSPTIVKVTPGLDAQFWEDCKRESIIVAEWDELGDLRNYDSKQSLFSGAQQLAEQDSSIMKTGLKQKITGYWLFRELKADDIVIATKGATNILGVGRVLEPGYEYMDEREGCKHVVHVQWEYTQSLEIDTPRRWGIYPIAVSSGALYHRIVKQISDGDMEGEGSVVPPEPIFEEIAQAMESKGQAILYGPPGTGKTYMARRFVAWWLQSRLSGSEVDEQNFDDIENQLSLVQATRRVWWVVANPARWQWKTLFEQGQQDFNCRRLEKNFVNAQPEDLVIGFHSSPKRKVVALAKISKALHTNEDGEKVIEIAPLTPVTNGLTFQEIKDDPVLGASEPVRHNMRGTLFSLTGEEAEYALSLLADRDSAVQQYVEQGGDIGNLTSLTFHASYSYEDFVEGFRPVDTGSGGLSLRLQDGVFKRVCREAHIHSSKPYVVFIDEFNRANVAKVLGELITLLERDKRGLQLILPQSKESFTIPPNVFLLGTMNTADRSIKLLDSALRRRFSFIEFMPDSNLFDGHKIGNLALDLFLCELNRRISKREGREKQVGHSFLLKDGKPITEPAEFARCFRQEILPLLQEYCYDDYPVLAEFVGDGIVDKNAQCLNMDILQDPDQLIESLANEFSQTIE